MFIEASGFIGPDVFSYHGGSGEDGLTGVSGWNEYPDHFVVTGFTEGFATLGSQDIGIESFHFATDAIPPGGGGMEDLRSLRRTQLGGSLTDRPAAMGSANATASGLPFYTGPLQTSVLGLPEGGGIGVDHRARVNVVGQTPGGGYPVQGGGRAYDASFDGVRSVLDMVPMTAGLPAIGRSDGTGRQTIGTTTFALPAGFSGGTTPLCALAPFGRQIGMPAPALPRILLEYEGPPPAAGVSTAAIVISRPTAPLLAGSTATSIVAATWRIGLPDATNPPIQLPTGLESFVPLPGAVLQLPGLGFPNQAFRLPLLPLPAGTTMTAQILCLILSPAPRVPAGTGPAPCTGGMTTDLTGSPTMWIVVP
jgi:hypothetical protein